MERGSSDTDGMSADAKVVALLAAGLLGAGGDDPVAAAYLSSIALTLWASSINRSFSGSTDAPPSVLASLVVRGGQHALSNGEMIEGVRNILRHCCGTAATDNEQQIEQLRNNQHHWSNANAENRFEQIENLCSSVTLERGISCRGRRCKRRWDWRNCSAASNVPFTHKCEAECCKQHGRGEAYEDGDQEDAKPAPPSLVEPKQLRVF